MPTRPEGLMKKSLLVIFLALAVASLPGTGRTANPEQFTTNYNLSARANLTVSPSTINFPDTDPTFLPLVPAAENPVLVTAKVRKDSSAALPAILTCLGGPLISGVDTIAAGNITWTASGAGFVGGTLNNTFAQTVGAWPSSGIYNGSLSFRLNNLWTYASGNYNGTIIFTLTAP